MSLKEKILLSANFLLYGFLAVFSYAYVDLNLTLSQNPMVLKFVASMQQLGYYNRPQATYIYAAFLILAFSFFILNLYLFYKSKVGLVYLALSTVINALVLTFAYPFLSHDIFNYMFDAKIITTYHASPYTHKPLDFPQDTWLRFMHWTHRYSPYGPAWLGLSAIPSVLGFGKFVLTLLLYKVMFASLHVLNAYLIYKTLKNISPSVSLYGTAFYALNPLFLIEGIANAHNDIFIATLLLLSVYFLTVNKKVFSAASLVFGALVKYIPALTLPWHLLSFFGKIKIPRLLLLNLSTMTAFTYVFSSYGLAVPFVSTGSTQVQFQPWYLFWTIPYVALIPKAILVSLAIAVSFGASLRYLPYIYYGDWSQSGTTEFMTAAIIIPPALAAILVVAKNAFKLK